MTLRPLFTVLILCVPAFAQTPALQVHGYIQGRFTNQEGTPDRLEIRRARLLFTGEPVSNLSYTVQADFVKAPYLMDLSLTWKFSPALRITAGQFKIPFSAESLISDNLNVPVARSRAVNSLAPGRDTGVQARDTGVQFAGSLGQVKHPVVEYAAGVFRGQTLIEAPKVHFQAVVGRVVVHPVRQLMLGADWYRSFSSTNHVLKRREEAEGGYDAGRVHFRAEQIWAQDGVLTRRGGYGLASWRVSQRWEPLTRADWLTSNARKPNTTSIAYLAGLNSYWGKHVKVGVNTGAQHDQGPRGFSSLFLAQTMVGF